MYVADTSLRALLPHSDHFLDKDITVYLILIHNSLAISPNTLKEVRKESISDEELSCLKKYCIEG